MAGQKPLPIHFLSHGGGPWPWLEDQKPIYAGLEQSLKAIPQELGAKPKAILIVSGHWETRQFSVMTSGHPPMVYDYSGFPAFTYAIKYRAPGAPSVADRIRALLENAGIPAESDPDRGFDHGAFTVAYPMYPEADVPVLQMSIRSDYDPAAHIAAGRALAPLREEGVLIIGSGLSYHNLGNFRIPQKAQKESAGFDAWLGEALCGNAGEARTHTLCDWETAPCARAAHPQEDHLIPLMVAAGAAENDTATRIYFQNDFFGGTTVSSYRFGGV